MGAGTPLRPVDIGHYVVGRDPGTRSRSFPSCRRRHGARSAAGTPPAAQHPRRPTAGYLIRFRPATRQAYQGDLASWLTFCDQAHIDPLTAGIHHADTYVRVLDELGDPRTGRQLSPASISRRVSAVAGFYRYAVRQRAVAESPFYAVDRPAVDEE